MDIEVGGRRYELRIEHEPDGVEVGIWLDDERVVALLLDANGLGSMILQDALVVLRRETRALH